MPAILGIGEQGRALDDRNGLADLVLPYLEHESEKVVRGALEAVGMLMGAEGKKFTGSISLIPGPVYPRPLISASGKTGYIPAQLCFTGSRKNGGNQMRLRESPRILSVTSEDT